MFVQGKRYDWSAIAAFYESGHTAAECQAEFGISNGAWHYALRRGVIFTRSRATRTTTRTAVAKLFAQGRSQAEIARELRVSAPTVCFHLRRLGIAAKPTFARRYDWERIREYYEAGHSAAECRQRFGFSRNAWADAIQRGAIELRPRLTPIDDVLAAGRRRNRQHVKQRMLTAGLKQIRCEGCGISAWRGAPISLELHHVNGDGLDNRLENLRLLCPNCHSQTDTWGARNRGRRGQPRARAP